MSYKSESRNYFKKESKLQREISICAKMKLCWCIFIEFNLKTRDFYARAQAARDASTSLYFCSAFFSNLRNFTHLHRLTRFRIILHVFMIFYTFRVILRSSQLFKLLRFSKFLEHPFREKTSEFDTTTTVEAAGRMAGLSVLILLYRIVTLIIFLLKWML